MNGMTDVVDVLAAGVSHHALFFGQVSVWKYTALRSVLVMRRSLARSAAALRI